MRPSDCVGCESFPCADVDKSCYVVPDVEVGPETVRLVMISEAAPAEAGDYYYAAGEALFQETTIHAFQEAGADVSSMRDILDLGVYFTTAVKCGKVEYGLKAATIKECSLILEQELALFPNVSVLMLMGDVAIRAVDYIAKRRGDARVIPAGSTYKIRGPEYTWGELRVFPSYLQAGPAYWIEASKRSMIAEDLGKALKLLG